MQAIDPCEVPEAPERHSPDAPVISLSDHLREDQSGAAGTVLPDERFLEWTECVEVGAVIVEQPAYDVG